MSFELPKLDYEYNALAPYIDARTMEIHHTKHHQAYVNNVNAAVTGTSLEGVSCPWELSARLHELPKDKQTAVRNNGGGHANHSLFWKPMPSIHRLAALMPSRSSLPRRLPRASAQVGRGSA